MSELYVSSENEKANYPRYYRVMSEKLAKAQRILSKRKKRFCALEQATSNSG